MLHEQINSEIKEAMRNKDAVKRDCLRMVIDKAKTIMRDVHNAKDYNAIPDDVIIDAINKEYKQLNQTKAALEGRETTNLYVETAIKMAILSGYLPKQMTSEEIKKAIDEILSEEMVENFGQQMKLVMGKLKGKADNKLIKELVEAYNK